MDASSLKSVALFEALTASMSRLDLFGYDLYLKYDAFGRGSAPLTPCRYSARRPDGTNQEFDGGFVTGSSILLDEGKARSVIFTLVLSWTRTEWFIHSWVEEEDTDKEDAAVRLWEAPELRAATIEGAIDALKRAVECLEGSAAFPTVATRLNEIRNRPKA